MSKPIAIHARKLLVPTLVGISLLVAFYVGQFVGGYDEHKKNELISERLDGYLGVDEVKRLGPLADMLRDGRVSDVDRMLKLYIKLKAKAVKKCMADPICTSYEMGSKQKQEEVQRFLTAAGATQ